MMWRRVRTVPNNGLASHSGCFPAQRPVFWDGLRIHRDPDWDKACFSCCESLFLPFLKSLFFINHLPAHVVLFLELYKGLICNLSDCLKDYFFSHNWFDINSSCRFRPFGLYEQTYFFFYKTICLSQDSYQGKQFNCCLYARETNLFLVMYSNTHLQQYGRDLWVSLYFLPIYLFSSCDVAQGNKVPISPVKLIFMS